MKRLTIIILLLASVNICFGAFKDGNALVDGWREYRNWGTGVEYSVVDACIYMGYVTGICDANDEVLFSIPVGTTVKQLCTIVGQYLENNPAEWTYGGDLLVTKSIIGVYGRKQ